jgi:hypothetical protein
MKTEFHEEKGAPLHGALVESLAGDYQRLDLSGYWLVLVFDVGTTLKPSCQRGLV